MKLIRFIRRMISLPFLILAAALLISWGIVNVIGLLIGMGSEKTAILLTVIGNNLDNMTKEIKELTNE